ncbi:MAG TPA: molybdopterin-dependent oxidoreductase [Thermoanaerobaculia bacterium]|jgi:sulfite oxidase
MTTSKTDSRLRVRQEQPLNAEPAPDVLLDQFFTPNEIFFIRGHGDIPAVDPAAFRLTVDGLVGLPLSLSLDDLRGFPRVTVGATLQCAGNRRRELIEVAPIPNELPWGSEAISNAEWSGVPLREVIAVAGPKSGARHAAFLGLDETERHGHRFQFGGSIPLAKALHPEVLLADTMNGKPLPPVHGAPLRVVVPGYIGARSVKWISRITLQEAPSDNYFQTKAYRLFPASVGPETVDWEKGMMLGESPVNSVICSPLPGERLPAGRITARGWAVAGGGREVARVDVSVDGGTTWKTADLVAGETGWTWRFWEAPLDLPAGEHEILCRAFDDAAQTQPAHPAEVWNFKGYANNAWHRVRVVCG